MLLDLQSWGLGMKTHEQIYALLSIFSSLATQNWKEHKKMRTHFLAFLSRNIPGGQIPIQLWAHHTKLKGDEKDIFFLSPWGSCGAKQVKPKGDKKNNCFFLSPWCFLYKPAWCTFKSLFGKYLAYTSSRQDLKVQQPSEKHVSKKCLQPRNSPGKAPS